MSVKTVVKHRFFTYKELVAKLKNKGLAIINEFKLTHCLELYNYQNIINGYKKPFLTEYFYKKYLPNANSQMIIDLFHFNREISKILISDLQSIEMWLSSLISYKLMEIVNQLHPGEITISALSNNEKIQLFKTNSNWKIISQSLQKNFDELKANKEYIDCHWTNWEEVPLYSLPLLWTFGVLTKLFTCLNGKIQHQILEKFIPIKNINIQTFISLLYCFKDLRNKISHHEPIYQFKFEISKITYKICLLNSQVNQQQLKRIILDDITQFLPGSNYSKNDFKLCWIVKIIASITNNLKLINLFKQKTKKLEITISGGFIIDETSNAIFLPCPKAWENIRNFLGYVKD